MSCRDEEPVYYREIQKNAYLKRIPNEEPGGKLRPLGHKKPPLKPMWTLFCVHNGRTPFLEQYPDAESPQTRAHAPSWRACLRAARHVTHGVRPRVGSECDFLVDTDHGAVRMLAPTWESMQDWVSCLRSKLHELKILPKGENVYMAAPAPPPSRAAARDPTSPLPAPPPGPPDRVPGIELITPPQPVPAPSDPAPQPEEPPRVEPEDIDISNWDTEFPSIPSTSQDPAPLVQQSVAKICGQNICLDDSILRRRRSHSDDEVGSVDTHESDESNSTSALEPTVTVNPTIDDHREERPETERKETRLERFKQRLIVNNDKEVGESSQSEHPASNITVIKVSNKPPHTAIPVLGPETDVFDFEFKQVKLKETTNSFVNIVNTEDNTENGYGTVFDKDENIPAYGHISLTTTVNLTTNVNLTGDKSEENEGIYERLCMASTSNINTSPLPVKKLKNLDKNRKSSLPNLDPTESTYEYLFPNVSSNINISNITLTNDITNLNITNRNINTNASISRTNINQRSNIPIRYQGETRTNIKNDTRCNITDITRPSISETSRSNINIRSDTRNNIDNTRPNINGSRPNNDISTMESRVHVNLTNSVSVGNSELISRGVRSNVERSHSQNAYDSMPRAREPLIRRVQSPKREKNDKSEPTNQKPIWRRGLTELSLLSRFRKRQDNSPNRHQQENERSVTSPVKVVHRSRPEARVDSTRRRSSSLSNGSPQRCPPLLPLRARQAGALRAEQRRGALPVRLPARERRLFVDYDGHVWVAWWSVGVRAGDRVAAVRARQPASAAHAERLASEGDYVRTIDILVHRVPLGKIYVLNKRDLESIGIKLDNECNIVSVSGESPAARAGLPPPGRWALTEVNNRPINLIKGGEEEMNRISAHGTEVSVLLQPSPLVKKIRAALKANKTLLSMR